MNSPYLTLLEMYAIDMTSLTEHDLRTQLNFLVKCQEVDALPSHIIEYHTDKIFTELHRRNNAT